jgi:hypothetical protein
MGFSLADLPAASSSCSRVLGVEELDWGMSASSASSRWNPLKSPFVAGGGVGVVSRQCATRDAHYPKSPTQPTAGKSSHVCIVAVPAGSPVIDKNAAASLQTMKSEA